MSDLDTMRDYLADSLTWTNTPEVVGLGGNVQGVQGEAHGGDGSLVTVLVTADDPADAGEWTVSLCPTAQADSDDHDHAEDDEVLYAGTVADVLDVLPAALAAVR